MAQMLGQAVANVEQMILPCDRRLFAESLVPVSDKALFEIGEYAVLIQKNEHGYLAKNCVQRMKGFVELAGR